MRVVKGRTSGLDIKVEEGTSSRHPCPKRQTDKNHTGEGDYWSSSVLQCGSTVVPVMRDELQDELRDQLWGQAALDASSGRFVRE